MILAVPVGGRDTIASLSDEADEIVCLMLPDPMSAVGAWYSHFEPTEDDEMERLLDGDPVATDPGSAWGREVWIPEAGLLGDLVVPEMARGVVVFAHGSGSTRHSPRNRAVARTLNERRFATLLLDLLTPEEELDRAKVFDVELLAARLVTTTRWAQNKRDLGQLPVGYFGASTGAAAALSAAAVLGAEVRAIVSRGGRPDLAVAHLREVQVPVLLIVGERDPLVWELNCDAERLIGDSAELAVVPDATHLFEEPGALERVARLAGEFFERHLVSDSD